MQNTLRVISLIVTLVFLSSNSSVQANDHPSQVFSFQMPSLQGRTNGDQGTGKAFAQLDLDNPITSRDNAVWELQPNGNLRWRFAVEVQNPSPDDTVKLHVNAAFSLYKMPVGGSMRILSPDGSTVHGPYTHRHNFAHEQLWTPIIPALGIVVDVEIPPEKEDEFQLVFKQLNINSDDPIAPSSMKGKLCFIDAVCSEGDDWGPQKRAVGWFTINGRTQCSGTLIANTDNDYTPYFITASHCGNDEEKGGNWWELYSHTIVVYWNFENSTCRPTEVAGNNYYGDGRYTNATVGGAEVVAWWSAKGSTNSDKPRSDTVLLKLNAPPDPSYATYFAGFDARDITDFQRGMTSISHPSSTEKRLMFTEQPSRIEEVFVERPPPLLDLFQSVEVFYVPSLKADGTPALNGGVVGGSSGSGFFDTNSRLVGTFKGWNSRTGFLTHSSACNLTKSVSSKELVPDINVTHYWQTLSSHWDGCLWGRGCKIEETGTVSDADADANPKRGYQLTDAQRINQYLDPHSATGENDVWDGMPASFELLGGAHHRNHVGKGSSGPIPQLVDKRFLWFEEELPLKNFIIEMVQESASSPVKLYLAKNYVPSSGDHDFEYDVPMGNVSTFGGALVDGIFGSGEPGTWYAVIESQELTNYAVRITPTYEISINQPVSNRGVRVYYQLPVNNAFQDLRMQLDADAGSFRGYGNADAGVSSSNNLWQVNDGHFRNFTNPVGTSQWNLLVEKNDSSEDYAYSFVVADSTEIVSGERVENSLDDENPFELYQLFIQNGAVNLTATYSDDVQICARRGSPPTDLNDCEFSGSFSDFLSIENPGDGTWYFLVHSNKETVDFEFDVVVTYDLVPGVSRDIKGERVYYRMANLFDLSGLHLRLDDSGGFSEFTLYAKPNDFPEINDFQFKFDSGEQKLVSTTGGNWKFLVVQNGPIHHQGYQLRVTPVTTLLSGEVGQQNIAGFGAWAIHRLLMPDDITNITTRLASRPNQKVYGLQGGVPNPDPSAPNFDFEMDAGNFHNEHNPSRHAWYYLIQNNGQPSDYAFHNILRQKIAPGQVRDTAALSIEYQMQIQTDPIAMSALAQTAHPFSLFSVGANQGNLPDLNNPAGNRWNANNEDLVHFDQGDNGGSLDGLWYFRVHYVAGSTGYRFQVILEDKVVIPLEDGVTTQGSMDADGNRYFKIAVPIHTLDMEAFLNNHRFNDLDLYATANQLPSTSDNDWEIATSSSDERGFYSESHNNAPQAGIWYFLADRYNGSGSDRFADFDITVSLVRGQDVAELDSEVPDTNTITPGGSHLHRINIPQGVDWIRAELSISGNRDFDLYARHEGMPSASNNDFRGTAPGNEDVTYLNPEAGYWYILVKDFTGAGGSYTLKVSHANPPEIIFADDFETDKGWLVNPRGTDTANQATEGQWERANPRSTFYSGPKQLGNSKGGTHNLVTGSKAGRHAGVYDVDKGITSIQSPQISLPPVTNGETLLLNFSYYLANASGGGSDYLNVTLSSAFSGDDLLLDVRGKSRDVDAFWQDAAIDITAYAGEVVTLHVEAADFGSPNVLEAAIDELYISKQMPAANLIKNGKFTNGLNNWLYWSRPEGPGIFSVTNGIMYAHIHNGGNKVWNVGIRQPGLLIENGKRYRVTFRAKADSFRFIQAQVEKPESSTPGSNYSAYELFGVDTQWADYDFEFTMQHHTDPNGQLEFDLGIWHSGVYIDDVILKEIP